MNIRTTGNRCRDCDRTLIGHKTWRGLPLDQRAELRATGYNRGATLEQCRTCYSRKGPLDTTVPRVVVLDEWAFLHESGQLHRGDSRARRIQQAAPRLGMNPRALEKALERAGVAS